MQPAVVVVESTKICRSNFGLCMIQLLFNYSVCKSIT